MKNRKYTYHITINKSTLCYESNKTGDYGIHNWSHLITNEEFDNVKDAEKYAAKLVNMYSSECEKYNESHTEDYQYVYAKCVETELTPSGRFVSDKSYIMNNGIFNNETCRARIEAKVKRLGHSYMVNI